MRLLHVLASLDPRAGGISQAVRSLVPELEGLGIQNEAVTCDAWDAKWIKEGTVKTHPLGPGRYGYAYTPALELWLNRNLERFDVIIVHGLWLWPNIAATRALARLRKDSSNTRRPKLFVMPHGMLDPYFQRDPARRLKAIRNWIYWKLFEHRTISVADGVLFTCEEEKLLAAQPFRLYAPKSAHVVGLGIATPPAFSPLMRDAFLSQCPELENQPYLLFLSRIHPKKGVDLLIRAYAKFASDPRRPTSDLCLPSLVIAGPGWDTDYGREMKQLIDQTNGHLAAENGNLKTENAACIHVTDMLTGEAKWGAFYGCEAFILPSHQENFGIAVVEALACNKPVLISDKVNIWREIKEARAGLVANDTEEGCVSLLEEFLQHPPFGRLPLECFSNNFEIHSAGRRFVSVFR